jgi:integrase
MLQFVGSDGRRQSVRLGKMTQRDADAVKRHVEALLFAKTAGHSPENDTAKWLKGLPQQLAERLSKVGLIAERESATLGGFLADYVGKHSDVKPGTATVYGHTVRCLLEFFGKDKLIRNITPGDASEWRTWLTTNQGLAENTTRRRSGIAKQFFNHAVDKEFIDKNPFAKLKASCQANDARFRFITTQEAERVLEACPDAQWRLLFALSRFGGLRCPSEHLALRWGDVDWERGRLTVHSPKTEHHPGGESRMIPLFPELRPHLETAFDQAEPGAVYVISRYREAKQNLRTQFTKIIKRAGLKPWPKLFQNLRSTRQTELSGKFPSHVVCKWIGNSQAVATKHYLQLTDDHFEAALQPAGGVLQKAMQSDAALCRTIQPEIENTRQNDIVRDDAKEGMGVLGFEPNSTSNDSTTSSGNQQIGVLHFPKQSLQNPSENDASTDAELQRLVHALSLLSNEQRQQLLKAVEK